MRKENAVFYLREHSTVLHSAVGYSMHATLKSLTLSINMYAKCGNGIERKVRQIMQTMRTMPPNRIILLRNSISSRISMQFTFPHRPRGQCSCRCYSALWPCSTPLKIHIYIYFISDNTSLISTHSLVFTILFFSFEKAP